MTYVYALILTAVTAVVVELMMPEGRMSGVVKGVLGLCLLVTLLAPIKEGIALIRQVATGEITLPQGGDHMLNGEDYQGHLRDELATLGEQEVLAWVSMTLEQVFGIASKNHTCTVTMGVAADGMTPVVERVTLILSGTAIFEDPHAIEAYIAEQLNCSCTVAVG